MLSMKQNHKRRWWSAPVLHFLLLGAALYAADFALRPPPAKQIVVSKAWVDALTSPPDAKAKAIGAYAREEALFRQALEMGLHKNDLVVRRRLVQQVAFIHRDLSLVPTPDDPALRQWIAAHPQRYHLPARRSFEHRFFGWDRRGDSAKVEAAKALEAGDEGDPFMAGASFQRRSQREVAGRFGQRFSEQVFDLEKGVWSNPIPSAFGLHIVRVLEVTPSRDPDLEEVRSRVSSEVIEHRREEAAAQWEEELVGTYEIVVEGAP
jgi:hypothetical protein